MLSPRARIRRAVEVEIFAEDAIAVGRELDDVGLEARDVDAETAGASSSSQMGKATLFPQLHLF